MWQTAKVAEQFKDDRLEKRSGLDYRQKDELERYDEDISRADQEQRPAAEEIAELLEKTAASEAKFQEGAAIARARGKWDEEARQEIAKWEGHEAEEKSLVLYAKAKAQVLANDLEVYASVERRQTAVRTARREELLAETALETAKTPAEKEAAESTLAMKKQFRADREGIAAHADALKRVELLPQPDLLKLKAQADFNLAELGAKLADLSRLKAEVAVEQSAKQATAARGAYQAALGPELTKREITAKAQLENSYVAIVSGQEKLDELRLLGLCSADPAANLEAARQGLAAQKKALEAAAEKLEAAQVAEGTFKVEFEAEQALTGGQGSVGVSASLEHLAKDTQACLAQRDLKAQLVKDSEQAVQTLGANVALLETRGVMAKRRDQQSQITGLEQAEAELRQLQLQQAKLASSPGSDEAGQNLQAVQDKEQEIKQKRAALLETHKMLEAVVEEVLAPEKAQVLQAVTEAENAEEESRLVQAEVGAKLASEPASAKLTDELKEAEEALFRARAEQTLAQVATEAAERDIEIAKLKASIANIESNNKEVFKAVSGLTDDAIEAKFLESAKDEDSAYQKLYHQMDMERRAGNLDEMGVPKATSLEQEDEAKANPLGHWVNNIRDAFVELVKQDQKLQDMGATLEDRQLAFAGVPKALWPPQFREELAAYREVSKLLAGEKEAAAQEEALKAEVKKGLLDELKQLGADAKPLLPIINLFADSYSLGSDMKSALHTPAVTAKSISLGVASALASLGISEVKAVVDFKSGEPEGGKDPAASEEAEHERTKKILELTLANLKASASATSSLATTVGHSIPGIDLAVSMIETAEKLNIARKAVKMSFQEGKIKANVDLGNDETSKRAFGNQKVASSNYAATAAVDLVAQGIQTVGSGAYLAHPVIGVGIKIVGKGLEYGNKLDAQWVNWDLAAKAKATLNKAQAGSHVACQQIFADHQMYATCYIALRAKDGDTNSLALCLARGIDQGKVLDEATSNKVIRELLLSAVGQADHMNTFTETLEETKQSVVKTWDNLGKVKSAAAAKFRKSDAEKDCPPLSVWAGAVP